MGTSLSVTVTGIYVRMFIYIYIYIYIYIVPFSVIYSSISSCLLSLLKRRKNKLSYTNQNGSSKGIMDYVVLVSAPQNGKYLYKYIYIYI